MAATLHGVVPPVCTPFTQDFSIDRTSLERLVGHLESGGVHGLFVLGSTSEVAFLPDDQRDEVVEVVRAATTLPILAGAIDMTTRRVARHIERAIERGADGIVVTAPFYTRTHPAEIVEHFRKLKDVCGDVPMYAYDLPVSVGTKLDAGLLVPLLEEGVLAGVKDSSGDDGSMRGLVLAVKDAGITDAAIFTGSELTVDCALFFGVDGVVPGIGNVDPAGYVRIYDAMKAGDLAAAKAEQERLFRMFGQ